MADFYGIYSNLLNGNPDNADYWMREEAVYQAFKIYDRMTMGSVQRFLPRTVAPDQNGRPCHMDDPFFIPVAVDPHMMAKLYDADERTKPYEIGFKREKCQAKLTKQWIPPSKPEYLQNRFKPGFMEMRNAMLTSISLDSVNLRVDYEANNVLAGNTTAVRQYSDQSLGRFKEFDASQTSTSAADYLSGAAWDNWDSDPMHDVEKVKLAMRVMAGREPTNMLTGPNTAFALENNVKVISQQAHFVNPVGKSVAGQIKGLTNEVISNLYVKDNAANAGKIGFPGLGSLKEDSWSDRNKYNFMNETISAATYEYALFLAGPTVGNTFCCVTDQDHKDPLTPYGNSWQDPETKKVFSNIQFSFAPVVSDFANVIKIKKIATKNW